METNDNNLEILVNHAPKKASHDLKKCILQLLVVLIRSVIVISRVRYRD